MTRSVVRALIVDDEPPARRKIRRFLDKDADVVVVGEAGNGERAIRAIRELEPDLVFLDLQMPKVDGFGVLESLKKGSMPEIVFVTAHDDYALRAFEVAALDYLLKPFDAERFAKALERAKERLRGDAGAGLDRRLQELLAQVERRPPKTGRLLVKTRDRAVLVNTVDVAWIQAAGNYIELHVGDRTYLMRETLHGMSQQLDPDTFLRVHRSFLVNADHIREIQPWSHGDHLIVMRDGTKVRLSRRYRHQLPASLRKSL